MIQTWTVALTFGGVWESVCQLLQSLLGQRWWRSALFWLVASKLHDGEQELHAAHFDTAAVVEQCSALPAGSAAPYQAGAAGFTVAG